MRAFVTFFLSPFNWYMVIFLVVVLLYFLKKHKEALQVFISGLLLLVVTSMSFLPELLVGSLERKYEILDTDNLEKDNSYYIMVMGAGFCDEEGIPITQRIEGIAMGRLIEGVRIQKELPGSILVVAGDKGKATLAQAEVMADVAIQLGADSILQLGTAKNTLGEALAVKEALGEGVHVIVSTDAIHMPRAMVHFEAAGLHAIAAPTNFRIRGGTKKYKGEWLPTTGHIDMLREGIKEYVGLLVASLERDQLK